MIVSLYDYAYRRKGQVRDFLSCSVDWVNLDVGTGSLVVAENHRLAPVLTSIQTAPVMVKVDLPDVNTRWSGRVVKATLDRPGKPGSGTVTASLVHDWIWMRYLMASQNGANPSLVGMPEFDTRTGPVATVAASFINAAAVRTGAPVMAVTPVGDDTAPVTLSGRFPITLSDLLTGSLLSERLALDVSIWVPGDAQPLNLSPDTPVVVFSTRRSAEFPSMRWSDQQGKISAVTMEITGPTAHDVIVGLAGDGAAKVYDRVTLDTGGQPLSPYEFPETFVDATNVALGANSQAVGRTELVKDRGSVNVAFTVQDGRPWTFGKHYREGDSASARISGVNLTAQIAKVTASMKVGEGLRIVPTIGDLTVTQRHGELLARAIGSVQKQVRMLQAGG